MIEDLKSVVDVSESTLYPVVRRLADGGFLQVSSQAYNGRLRHYYALTAAGIKKLKSFNAEGRGLHKVLQFILNPPA
jgi:PadR family transcriptional regulator PadR